MRGWLEEVATKYNMINIINMHLRSSKSFFCIPDHSSTFCIPEYPRWFSAEESIGWAKQSACFLTELNLIAFLLPLTWSWIWSARGTSGTSHSARVSGCQLMLSMPQSNVFWSFVFSKVVSRRGGDLWLSVVRLSYPCYWVVPVVHLSMKYLFCLAFCTFLFLQCKRKHQVLLLRIAPGCLQRRPCRGKWQRHRKIIGERMGKG